MDGSSLEDSQHSADKTTYTDALAAWTEAAFDLFINFKKVKNCLKQNEISNESAQSNYIGQCSREQIVTLVSAMQTALDTLLQELELLSTGNQADYNLNHLRLISQIASLNQLNQRAKRKLLLTTLSAT